MALRGKAECAAAMAVFAWVLWVNVQETGKPPVWETKGPFENTTQCRNAIDIELERIKKKEGSKIEITKWYDFGASLTFKPSENLKMTQSYYCLPQGFEFFP